MIAGAEEAAEPDLLILSNRWIIVVEVKLESGLGVDQPWREYCVGKGIAQERGLPDQSVFYWLVSRQRLNVEGTFISTMERGREDLFAKTSHLLWHQAVALIERWLKSGDLDAPPRAEHHRLLLDLLNALRRRRTIAFSGFAFINQDDVFAIQEKFFCPFRFSGFLARERHHLIAPAELSHFLSGFEGFLSAAATCPIMNERLFVPDNFAGFGAALPAVAASAEPLLRSDPFLGLLNDCPECLATSTLCVRDG